jgi:hypothetical protein
MLHGCNDRTSFSRSRTPCPILASGQEDTRPRSIQGLAMSELIVLVSCGAAFVTGLVIAGMSLIG